MSTRFYYGWWLVVVAFLVQVISSGTITYSFSVIATPIASEFNVDYSQLVLATSIMFLTTGIASPFVGPLLDSKSLKAFMAFGCISLFIGFLLLSMSQNVWQVIAIYAVFISIGSLLLGALTASTLVARWFENKRGQALGIAAIGTSVGGLLFPPLIQWLVDSIGWRAAMQYTAGSVIVLALLPVLLLVKNRPQDMGLNPDGADTPAASADNAAHAAFASSYSVLKTANFWLLSMVMGALFGVYLALLQNFIPLAGSRDVATAEAAWLISLIAIAGMVGKLIFGTLADRIDLRHGLSAAITLIIIALYALQSVSGLLAVAAACVALGLSAGGMLPVWGALIARLFGAANYGRVMGMMSPVLLPFMVVGPPAAGKVFDNSGSFTPALQASIVILLLALALLYRLPGKDKAQVSHANSEASQS